MTLEEGRKLGFDGNLVFKCMAIGCTDDCKMYKDGCLLSPIETQEKFYNWCKAIDEADAWIPVKERKPEFRDWVLVAWEEISTGFRGIPKVAELRPIESDYTNKDGWSFMEDNFPMPYLKDLRVIAWKPIKEYEG